MEEGVEHANNTREHWGRKWGSWNSGWPRSRSRSNEDLLDAHESGKVVDGILLEYFLLVIILGATTSGLNA